MVTLEARARREMRAATSGEESEPGLAALADRSWPVIGWPPGRSSLIGPRETDEKCEENLNFISIIRWPFAADWRNQKSRKSQI